jgi:hypothetical protein
MRVTMTEKTCWETIKGEGHSLMDKLRAVIHEGNVRRVVVQHEGRTVAEFPLTAGVVGALLAPPLAAVATIVAMLKDCTIQVERVEDTRAGATTEPPRAAAG